MNRRLRIALRIAVILVIAVALWWFARSMDLGQLWDDLASAKLWPIVLAATLNFGMLWGKALCWRIALAPAHRVPTRRLFRYTIAAFAASAIVPARGGEVLRVWVLRERDGVPIAASTATAISEKLFDGVSMLLLAAPLPWVLPDLPAWVGNSIAGCAAVAIGAFVILYIAVGRAGEGTSWIARFFAGMHVLRSARRTLSCIAVLVGVWLLDLSCVMLAMYAVGIDQPVGTGLFVLFALNLAVMLPSTPAQLGALELGAMGALQVMGVAKEPAGAFALIYHGLQVIPLIAVALVLEMPLVLGREQRTAQASPP